MDFSLSEFLSGATALYLTKELVKWYKTFRGKNADLAQNMKDIQEIHDIMEHITRHTCYDRFAIFMAEDSAGMITVGKKIYVSAQYEKILPLVNEHGEEQPDFSLIDLIQRWRADDFYYKIFSEMVSNGSVSLCTENMPKSNLKDIYLSQNIKSAEIYHLMTTKGLDKVFYCSIATRGKAEVEAEDRVKVTSAISQLIEIFKRHRKYY